MAELTDQQLLDSADSQGLFSGEVEPEPQDMDHGQDDGVEDGSFIPDAGVQEGGEPSPDGVAPPEPPAKPEPVKEGDQPSDWDKQRQQADQNHASEVRSLRTQNDAQSATIEAMRARLENPPAPKEPEKPEEDPFKDLTEESDAADIVAAIKTLNGINQSQRQEMAGLKTQLAEQKQRADSHQEETDEQAAEREFGDVVRQCNTDFGPQYAAEARQKAEQFFVAEGYGPDKIPDQLAVRLCLREQYRELRDADPQRKQPRVRPNPLKQDDGSGSGPVAKQEHMTLDDAFDSMKAKGDFDDS